MRRDPSAARSILVRSSGEFSTLRALEKQMQIGKARVLATVRFTVS